MKDAGIHDLDRLIRKYLRVDSEVPLLEGTTIASLGAAEWCVIDLGIAVHSKFGVELTAESALALRTVGDWRRLIQRR